MRILKTTFGNKKQHKRYCLVFLTVYIIPDACTLLHASLKAIGHFPVKEGYSNMGIGCPIQLYQQICKQTSTPGIWQQRGTAAARGISDAFHPAANLKPGNSPFLQHKA